MSEETAIVIRQNDTFLAPVVDLATILNAYQVKKEFIEKALKPGLDFGPIPGAGEKKVLLKPGAEKLANIYGFAPTFEDVITIEDWSGADHDGEPFFYYRQKCKLYRGERLVGSADGSCTSWEKKYRYRNGQRVCPKCGQPTIFQSKPPKTGFYCWSKKGGCGAQFQANDTSITGQEIGQVKNPDICDAVNTVLKMAQKRALVAAILITTGASDYFTQDIEDFIDVPVVEYEPAQEAEYRQEQTPAPKTNGKAKAAPAVQPAMDGSVTDRDFWNRANPMVKAKVITGKEAYEIGAKHAGNWTAAIAELEEISGETADEAARAEMTEGEEA